MFRPRASSSKHAVASSAAAAAAAAAAALSGAIPSTFTDGLPLPSLFVFDLDYTLWPFWVDTHVTPPLKPVVGDAGGVGARVRDSHGETFRFFDDVGNVLAALRQRSIKIAAASRSTTPEIARDMLKLLHIPTKPVTDPIRGPVADLTAAPPPPHPTAKAIDAFDYLQIYPGSKLTHFERLGELSGLGFEEMLFFDDEMRNREVEELGVVMWLVRDGISNDEIDKGVLSWRKRNRRELQ